MYWIKPGSLFSVEYMLCAWTMRMPRRPNKIVNNGSMLLIVENVDYVEKVIAGEIIHLHDEHRGIRWLKCLTEKCEIVYLTTDTIKNSCKLICTLYDA